MTSIEEANVLMMKMSNEERALKAAQIQTISLWWGRSLVHLYHLFGTN